MKKLFCVLLAIVLLATCAVSAVAEEDSEAGVD